MLMVSGTDNSGVEEYDLQPRQIVIMPSTVWHSLQQNYQEASTTTIIAKLGKPDIFLHIHM